MKVCCCVICSENETNKSDRWLKAESEQAAARSAVAAAALHVAHAEQTSATLQRVVADSVQQILAAGETAGQTDRLVHERRRTEEDTNGKNEAQEIKIKEQHEKDADADVTKTADNEQPQQQQQQQQQQEQQSSKVNEVKKTQAQTTQGKKRNSPSTENNKIRCQTQLRQEDVSSWSKFM